MVRIKVFKLSQLIYWAVIIVAAVAVVGLVAGALLSGNDGGQEGGDRPLATPSPAVPSPEALPPETLPPATLSPNEGGLPSRGGEVDRHAAATAPPAGGTSRSNPIGKLSKWLFGVDLSDPASLLAYHLPVVEAPRLPETSASAVQVSSEVSWREEDEATGEEADGEHIRIEIARITGPYKPARGKILIYHTHTYEAYEQVRGDLYVEAAKWRTTEERQSVVAVGAELARRLRAMGYEVVHDTTAFEPPRQGTAYERSLAMLERRRERGEEYAMVIDLHRDAWDTATGTTARAEGEDAARLMMLIGTGEGSDGETFAIKPNWQENYKLANALTERLNADCPGLCRDVLLKTGRYNQHMSEHAVLIEVGNQRNTLEEAVNAAAPLAKAIDKVLRQE